MDELGLSQVGLAPPKGPWALLKAKEIQIAVMFAAVTVCCVLFLLWLDISHWQTMKESSHETRKRPTFVTKSVSVWFLISNTKVSGTKFWLTMEVRFNKMPQAELSPCHVETWWLWLKMWFLQEETPSLWALLDRRTSPQEGKLTHGTNHHLNKFLFVCKKLETFYSFFCQKYAPK